MDLWNTYKDLDRLKFGTERLYLSTGNRWNVSLKKASEKGVELRQGGAKLAKYSDLIKYVLAIDITFDLFVSIYDVNSGGAIVVRPARDLKSADKRRLQKLISGFKRPNFELRFIGFQNNWTDEIMLIDDIKKMVRPSVIAEFDLFGSETRHLALDLKTGVPYNLLLINRIYRPGELLNPILKDQYFKTVSDLTFV